MTFTAITDSIPLQPGVQAYNMIASGSITKGQGVYLCGNEMVAVPPDAANAAATGQYLFGISDGTVNDGEYVAIYGPLNLVRAKLSGNQPAGTLVGLHAEGYLCDSTKCKYATGAIVVKGVSSTGEGEVLLLGCLSG